MIITLRRTLPGILLALICMLPARSAVVAHPPVTQDPLAQDEPANAESGETVRLTLLPDYVLGSVNALGEVDKPCSDTNLPWLPRETLSLSIEAYNDGTICIFDLERIGTIAPTEASPYTFLLPQLTLGEKDSLAVSVPAADILADRMEPQLSYLGITAAREIDGPRPDGLTIPVHPWRIQTDLAINPVLTEDLTRWVGADVLMSGETTISDIQDQRVYQRLVSTPTNDLAEDEAPLIELLVMQIDYLPLTVSDTYPGLNALVLATSKDSTALWFDANIISHHPPNSEGPGQIHFSFIGGPRRIGDEEPSRISIALDDRFYSDRIIPLKMVSLGPQDTLRVSVPNSTISKAEPSPNDKDNDYLSYQGPRRFDLQITYTPTVGMWLRLLPFVLRRWLVQVEEWLAQPHLFENNALIASIASEVLAIVILVLSFFGVMFTEGKRSQDETNSAVKRLWLVASFVLWAVTGLALLYLTPSVTSLILLGVLSLAPITGKMSRREIVPLGVVALLVIIDNMVILFAPTLVKPHQQVSELTPVLMLVMITFLMVYYIRLFGRASNRRVKLDPEEKKMLNWDRIPVFAIGLLVLATYESMSRSLLSLAIIVVCGFIFSLRVGDIAEHILKARREAAKAELEAKKANPQPIPQDDATPASPPVKPKVKRTGGFYDVPFWLEPMNRVINRPLAIGVLALMAILAIGSAASPLFTLVTVIAIVMLFTVLYEFIRVKAGYIKAILFVIPLLLIFFLGIGASTIDLARKFNYTAGLLNLNEITFPLFLNHFEELLAGRIVFYLSGPMFVGLYVEYGKSLETDPTNIDQTSWLNTLGNFIRQGKGIIELVAGILAILAPQLLAAFSNEKALSSFSDLLQQILNFTGGS